MAMNSALSSRSKVIRPRRAVRRWAFRNCVSPLHRDLSSGFFSAGPRNRLVSLICWLSILLICLPAAAFATERAKKVLIFGADRTASALSVEKGIRSALLEGQPFQLEFYNESRDEARIPDANYEAEFVGMLQHKYQGQDIDLVLAIGNTSLDFLLEHESELFTGVPKVFTSVDFRDIASLRHSPEVTGVTGKLEFGKTLDFILDNHPKTKTVVVISGSAKREEFFLNEARKDFAAYAGRVEFLYLSKLPIEELQRTLATLPPDNVVFLISYGLDPSGRGYSLPTALDRLQPTAAVPIYISADIGVGAGGVGGNLLSFELIGKRAGEIGVRILSGESPSDIPYEVVENVPMFDARQLRRWNIDESSAPAGSILRFRSPTMWEEYKWEILGVAAFSIFETLLIGWLLFIRSRKERAEEESKHFAALAAREHKRLDEVVANVPGVVWESRIVPGTEERYIEFISDHAELMLGYTAEEIRSTPNFWRSVVIADDNGEREQDVDEILTGRRPGVQQLRCRRKDGSTIWVDAHLVPTHDEDGNFIGLRGVAIDVTDRELAQEGLQQKEMDLSEAQRLAQIGSWEWDPATDTVRWSEELYRIAGIDPAMPAPSYRDHRKLYTPESYERLAACVEEALEKATPYEVELQMIRGDGNIIWTSARGEVLRDNDGKIIKVRGTLQDISAGKGAEEALTESESRYRNVVETQTELICRYLPDCTLTFVNDAYCRCFGKTREELIGSKFLDLVPEHARQPILNYIESLIKDPRTEMYEHEVIRADGTTGWHQWIDRVIQTPGKPLELQGIGRDITEKRWAEDALRASENRFRTMADSAPLMIWMSGTDGLCTYVNQGWCQFTGRQIDSELGNGWTKGIHPDDRERSTRCFDSAFEKKETFNNEYRLRAADGDFRWVFSSGAPRFSPSGEFLGFIGSCVDISEQKSNEDALKKALDEVRELQKQLHEENIYLKEVIELGHRFDELIGHSDPLKYVLYKIEQVAKTEATVLISGETGTGKELVARAIHSASVRKYKPLVSVNCAALSATLIESELFGHERGAFTGASSRKIGRFELAHGATIFLDEVGELPLEMQAKLLRVVQEGEFQRLGSSKTIKVDARIIAATNRNLDIEVSKGNFREDLLFRLNVFPITVPPLRERKEDIPELVEHFANRFSKKIGKTIRSVSPATIRMLSEHSWPGNVRELANVIERSVINSLGETLSVFPEFAKGKPAETLDSSFDTLESVERKYIRQVLVDSGWRIEGERGAARILGLNPSTLRTRMSKLGISKPRTEPSENRLVI